MCLEIEINALQKTWTCMSGIYQKSWFHLTNTTRIAFFGIFEFPKDKAQNSISHILASSGPIEKYHSKHPVNGQEYSLKGKWEYQIDTHYYKPEMELFPYNHWKNQVQFTTKEAKFKSIISQKDYQLLMLHYPITCMNIDRKQLINLNRLQFK